MESFNSLAKDARFMAELAISSTADVCCSVVAATSSMATKFLFDKSFTVLTSDCTS